MRPVINYVEVPATQQEDINSGKSAWRNGKLVMLDEGRHVTVYLGHKAESRHEEDGTEKEVTVAFPVRIEKPATKAGAINSAEMEAYGLSDPMGVASLNASLARKWRLNINDLDVKEHDDFIAWVKRELDASGLFSEGADRVDSGQPTLEDVMSLSSIVAEGGIELTDTQSARLKRFYPEWDTLIGKMLAAGRKVRNEGKLYKVLQQHTASIEWKPDETPSLFGLLSEHEGTMEDPIPYERMMLLEKGKYYTQYGVTYKCVTDSITGYDADLTELMSLLEIVSQEGGAE